jgi:cell division protease FtsH
VIKPFFDRKTKVSPPGAKGRSKILKAHANRVKLSLSVDLYFYANNLLRWSGANLAQLLQEVALVAISHGHNSIFQSDINNIVNRLMMGLECKGLELISPFL